MGSDTCVDELAGPLPLADIVFKAVQPRQFV